MFFCGVREVFPVLLVRLLFGESFLARLSFLRECNIIIMFFWRSFLKSCRKAFGNCFVVPWFISVPYIIMLYITCRSVRLYRWILLVASGVGSTSNASKKRERLRKSVLWLNFNIETLRSLPSSVKSSRKPLDLPPSPNWGRQKNA